MIYDQALVLRTLQGGRQLTDRQIAVNTAMSIRRAHRALRVLYENGLLRHVTPRQTWELSSRGLSYIRTPTGQAMLDVPRSALAG